ncbi:transporter substrate-binding domain-containing protein [Chelatococcus reniformis]|uniref:Amino acid ABC substrate-binding protein n=1 Tax=Chelatococcus reniformis TaxID=1494448 RepID=A0A916TWU0_9HYPH|nr:transporter substrate-binding domain-containing protein [Chelatococcus reniformis]GGC46846.1 amino acid ABC substrate-binding protein [Chelatococcus reniformis]
MAAAPGWPNEPLKVGVLFSSSGVTSAVERTQLLATLLAIDEINRRGGIGGRPIEPLVQDPQSNPKLYRQFAEQLLKDDGARIIFGCYMSSARKAVLPLVEARDALLVYPTLYEGFEYSPNCIYTGAVPNQNSLPLAKYILENHGNRVLLVGSNYIFPYESNRIFSDLIIEARGKVLDELYVPLSPAPEDFARTLRQIEKLKPDTVFSTIVGAGTAMFYEAYRRAGFNALVNPIASLTTSEAEVAEMSAEAAEGHLTAAPYFASLQTPANLAFVSAYRERFGPDIPVTAAAEAAYFQVHLVASALAQAGSLDRRDIVAAMRGVGFEAPQGAVALDPENHHTYLWPRVARLDADKQFRIIWNPNVRMKPDPYFVSGAMNDWSPGGRAPARAT